MLVAVLGSSFVHKQQRRRSYKDNNKKERMAITAPTTTLFSHKSHPYYQNFLATITDDVMAQSSTINIKKKSHPLSPPTWLQELPLHSPMTVSPAPILLDEREDDENNEAAPVGGGIFLSNKKNLTITRVSIDSPVFHVKNFCSEEQTNTLINYSLENDMEYSGTSAGDMVKQRVGSYTGWIYPTDTADHIEEEKGVMEDENTNAKDVAGYMTELSRLLFVPPYLKTMIDHSTASAGAFVESLFSAEALQVVRYEIRGKYDVHHDGMNRFLTVLTYLNGVAGTWFPYAIVDNEHHHQQQSSSAEDDTTTWNMDDLPSMGTGNVAHDKTPGTDGLLVISQEHDDATTSMSTTTTSCNSNNVLRIKKGDALLFYNYDWIENLDGDEDLPQTGPIINWRSIHSGMRTTEEKWIATNWFYFHE